MTGNHCHKITFSLPGVARPKWWPWEIWARAWKADAPLFLHASQAGSDDAEGVGAAIGAERAARALLEFRQADGALRGAVAGGLSRVNEDTPHRRLARASAAAGWGRRLFYLPTPPRRGMFCRSD